MSDRTQLVSVELTWEEIWALLESDAKPETPAFVSGHDKLHSALTQLEHQGDEEEAARKRWPDGFAPFSPLNQGEIKEAAEAAIADRLNEVYMRQGDSAAVWAEAALQLQARLDARPPAPAPSDEDRERLEDISDHIEAKLSLTDEDAAFLRNFASQGHQNEGLDIRDLQGMRLRAHPAPSDSQGEQGRSVFHCDRCHTSGTKPCDCDPASTQGEVKDALKPFVEARLSPGRGPDCYQLEVTGDDIRRAKAALKGDPDAS